MNLIANVIFALLAFDAYPLMVTGSLADLVAFFGFLFLAIANS